ncbi:MAG TPA: DUF2235 domain-containing protein, partial [Anseongella sp.]|nr:DUF2235 domain-containing protein [Anseongella sp.]
KMIGVWDTVGALGIPSILSKPFTWFFLPVLLSPFRKLGWIDQYHFLDTKINDLVENAYHALAIDEARRDFYPTLWERGNYKGCLEQVWFSGVHTNIGGGYEDTGLSDLTLDWMISKAEKHGLKFNQAYREQIKPDMLGELRDSRFGFNKYIYGRQVRAIEELMNKVDQSIKFHWSVRERMRRSIMRYRPQNLPDQGDWYELD